MRHGRWSGKGGSRLTRDPAVLKWVIDTDQDKSAGTEEEMREALEQVTAGNVPLPSEQDQGAAQADPTTAADASSAPTSAVPSAAATGPVPTPSIGTPATGTPAPADATSAQAAIPSTELAHASNPIAQAQGNDPAKPAEGPAPGGEAISVQEAVKGLGEVEMDAAVDAGPSVPDEAKSLVQEDQVAPQA